MVKLLVKSVAFLLEMVRFSLMSAIATPCCSPGVTATLNEIVGYLPVMPSPMRPSLAGWAGLKRLASGSPTSDLLTTPLVCFLNSCICFAAVALLSAALSGRGIGLGYPLHLYKMYSSSQVKPRSSFERVIIRRLARKRSMWRWLGLLLRSFL